MLKRLLILTALMLPLSSPALAQVTVGEPDVRWGDQEEPAPEASPENEPDVSCQAIGCTDDFPVDLSVLFDIGYSRYGLTDLNKAMQAKGYSPFSEHMLSLGGSMQVVLWHVITEFETSFSFASSSINDSYVSSLGAGNFLLNFGYQFKPVPQLSIYPLLGLGLGFLDLDFRRRSLLPSFDEFLTNPGRQGRISNLFFTLNAGLGIDWQWDWGFQ
ncbi:MAG: hypothetical protein ACAI44_21870, partial [Candidatus Sericytochromatia bacterium]